MKKATYVLFNRYPESPSSHWPASPVCHSPEFSRFEKLPLSQLLIAFALTGCSLNMPGPSERQYHLVFGAAPTPPSVAVNMRKSELGLSITPGLLNTSSEASPGCPRMSPSERPGTINLAPHFLSFNVGDHFLFGVLLAEETNQSTMLELLCEYP